ncbi:serine hydrolase domain-containing protein [Flavihumibacter petaseus]|uniref:Peptidase S12 family protein n=1 Tax=Flavihumibacter petaseus NBRC 106054 TaxID=1220578 RepID=A0A0E9MZS6_9BACT|nr:serine hydrolase domain-containing protein [Flavihumibacter petaseus]GAO43038.1 peptidase S12 family protein [Flavihumibacter petaseus NBRC 106054]
MKHSRLLPIVILLALVTGPLPSLGQVTTLSEKKITAAAIDGFIKAAMDSLQMPGLSVTIINDGKIVYNRSMGFTNIDKGTKTDETTIFEAGSLSKPVFTFFVLKMVDEGLLNLDTPLYRYMPYSDIDKDERYTLITARIVLSHQSGFPNWRYFEKPDSTLHIKYGELWLKFTPGTQFAYSGEGYFYLAKVIAQLKHTNLQGLDSVFQSEIARPLHLQHFYFSGNPYISQHKATGYKQGKVSAKKWPVAFPTQDSSWFGAAGGLHTNVTDYANFLVALMNEKGISKSLLSEMLQPQIELPKASTMVTEEGYVAWGLGIALKNSPYGVLHLHGGNNGDFQSGFVIDKSKKWGFVFFTNCDKGSAFNKKLQALLLQ